MNIKSPEENKEQFSKERVNRVIAITFAVFIFVGIVMSVCYEMDLIPKETEEKQSYIKEVKNLFHLDNVDFVDSDKGEAKTSFQDGKAYFDEGNFDEAIWSFNNALILNPEFAEAYNSRGFAYLYLNKFDLAMQDFNKAIELNPEFFEAYLNRGKVYRSKHKYKLAFRDFNKALKLNPEYSEAYIIRANLYAINYEFENALRDCDRAIELNPKDHRAYFLKAVIYEEWGKDEEAIKFYGKYIEVTVGLDTGLNPIVKKTIKELEKKIDSSSSE